MRSWFAVAPKKTAAALVVASLVVAVSCQTAQPVDNPGTQFQPNFIAGDMFQLSGSREFPNGAWCWFQDPRAIVDIDAPGGPILLVASFSGRDRAEYGFRPWGDPDATEWAKGDNDLYWMRLGTGETGQVKLHSGLTQDDHNVGALTILPDGHYLTAYADHGYERETYFRISAQPHDPTAWQPVTTFTHGDTVTYSNLYSVPDADGGQVLMNLNRSVDYDPNIIVSEDNGTVWQYRGLLLGGEGRPYVRYAQGPDRVHFIATDQHPRDFDNSVFHGSTDGIAVFDSAGETIDADLSDDAPAEPKDLTEIHQGRPDAVGWAVDLEVDANGNPYGVFSVQRNAQDRDNLPGLDHRYHYARFDGTEWSVSEVAYAGSSLYEIEQDYTGLAALDPNDPDYMVISTNADPDTGKPLISRTDGQRHWELFEGRTVDGGETWSWSALTRDSAVDNIRPIIPDWEADKRVILWMRGDYNSYHDWNTQIVGIKNKRRGI